MKSKKMSFSLYRYQLVPLSTTIQTDLFDDRVKSYSDLISYKNSFFLEALLNPKASFRGKGYQVITKVEYQKRSDILMKFGLVKIKEFNSPDFKKTSIKDYPNVYVYFNNATSKQLILIEHNFDAFSDSKTVANIIQKGLSNIMSNFQLALYIEQTFNANDFWETVNQYAGQITALKFEFIKPNLSNITKTIKKVFSAIENTTNSHKTDLNLHAPGKGSLENIEKSNELISGIVSYQKEGGGPPPILRAKGVRKNIKTVNSEKTIEIDEFTGQAKDLIKILKGKAN